MKTLDVGKDFAEVPSGRFYTDGDSSGEKFREEFLMPALNDLPKEDKLTVVLDSGVEGYGSSFLVEGFAGAVKYGYLEADDLLSKLRFSYENDEFKFYEKKIRQYINEAKFNSKKYIKSK